MDYLITVASADEAEEIARLVNSAYRGDSSRAGWTTEADYLDGQRTNAEELREHMLKGSMLVLRERPESEILSCVALERLNECEFYLGMLTVKPTGQAQGVGRVLLTAAEDFARRQGARWMSLRVVHLREPLIAWYERRGYKATGEIDPFPYDEERFGQPKIQGLSFIRFKKELD